VLCVRHYYLFPTNIQIATGNTAPATFWRYAQHKVKDERARPSTRTIGRKRIFRAHPTATE
jgi:hypothetical protein